MDINELGKSLAERLKNMKDIGVLKEPANEFDEYINIAQEEFVKKLELGDYHKRSEDENKGNI